MNIILVYFSIKYKGDWDKIYKALEEKEKVTLDEINKIEEMVNKSEYKIITIIDKEYPEALKSSYKPPFVIWLKGNEMLIQNKILMITGNQDDSQSDKRINQFVPEVEMSHTIISGSFKGLDEKIIKNRNKGIIYILANGLDEPIINSEFKDGDLMITEYPPETGVSKERFRNRNRIIAAFAQSLVLITSLKDGAINNLVTNFLNIGKEIYCFPGDGNVEDGNSELIKQGANLITGIKDISN